MKKIRKFINKRIRKFNSVFVRNKCLIILYHSISNLDQNLDPYSLNVSPDNFREHLELIKNNFHPISLKEFLNQRINKEIKRNTIVLTFDDGYANNYYIAKPLLEEFQIPATFFIASGFWGSFFWWDILTMNLPATNAGKKIYLYGKEFYFDGKSEQRLNVQEEIFSLLKSLNYSGKKELLDNILNLKNDMVYNNDLRCMTKEELVDFSKGPYVEIGGHTVNHFPLSTLDYDSQLNEILVNKKGLEEIIQKEICLFAYPHGDYNDITMDILKENSFKSGIAVNFGFNHSASDMFQLNRTNIKNWDAATFLKQINYWL